MKQLIKFISIIFIISIMFISLSCNTKLVSASPKEGKKLEEFIDKNQGILTKENIDSINIIIEKLNKYEVITQDERDYIRECELSVIRSKLGDAQFEEYKKLIERRAKEADFPQHDRLRIYELEKLLK